MSWTEESPLELDAHNDASEPYELSESEVRFVTQTLPDMMGLTYGKPPLTLQRDVGGTRIESTGAAGTVILPTGRAVQLHPTAGVENFLYMWAYATGFDGHSLTELSIPTETGDMLLEIFARLFETELANLLRSGLQPAYHEESRLDDQPRGQLDLQRQIQQAPFGTNVAYRQRSLTYDTTLNKGIRRATEHLVQVLPSGILRDRLYSRLMTLRDYISETDVTAADMKTVEITRLSADAYHRLLPMVKSLLEWGFIGDIFSGRSNRGCALVVRMWKLHEAIVERAYERAANRFGLRTETQDRHSGFISGANFHVKPDIVIYDGSNPVAVLDAKWKNIDWKPENKQLYQLSAYIKILDTPGMLIYPDQSIPKTDFEVEESHALKATSVPLNESVESYEKFSSLIEKHATQSLRDLFATEADVSGSNIEYDF